MSWTLRNADKNDRQAERMEWLRKKVRQGEAFREEEAVAIVTAPDERLGEILEIASAVRHAVFGDTVRLCSILNAKSGRCGEDCVFCAQSARHPADVDTYPLLESEEILAAYQRAGKLPIRMFGIVTSGRAVADDELARLCRLIRSNACGGIHWCASLGALDVPALRRLRDAGLRRFHHNLETSESYFRNVCTTHTYADRVRTVHAAKSVGLEVCSGGLFGLGEQPHHRVELALALRQLEVDSIPLNFLVPIPGVPAFETAALLSPEEILKTIAMFRLVCPRAEIKVCAGRERYLGDMEKLIFSAGATGMMIGGYLTVRGRSAEQDLELIRKAGMNL